MGHKERNFDSDHAKKLKKHLPGRPIPADGWDEFLENTSNDDRGGGMSESKINMGKHFHPQRSRGPTKG